MWDDYQIFATVRLHCNMFITTYLHVCDLFLYTPLSFYENLSDTFSVFFTFLNHFNSRSPWSQFYILSNYLTRIILNQNNTYAETVWVIPNRSKSNLFSHRPPQPCYYSPLINSYSHPNNLEPLFLRRSCHRSWVPTNNKIVCLEYHCFEGYCYGKVNDL